MNKLLKLIFFRVKLLFSLIQFILKIRKIKFHRNNTVLRKSTVLSYNNRWNKLSHFSFTKYLKSFVSISGIESDNYIPEYIYYNKIEPVLNNRIYTQAYADKNIYNILLSDYSDIFPKVILRNINGILYDTNYKAILKTTENIVALLREYNEFILKPASDTGGGLSVLLFKKNLSGDFISNNNEIFNLELLEKYYKKNFIIQEYIIQRNDFELYNKDSLNTIRLFTYRSVIDNKIIPLSGVLRIGIKGKIVDNQASGGISIGIKEDGTLNKYAIDKYGTILYSYNGVSFHDNKKIEEFELIKSISKEISGKLFYSRLNGFDFCIDTSGKIRLIEINMKNIEINFLQMNRGPLFGRYTDEIIDYCLKNPISICYDFYIEKN